MSLARRHVSGTVGAERCRTHLSRERNKGEARAIGFSRRCRVTRRQQAPVAADAMAPVTVAGVALIRCGCSMVAYGILGLTAVACFRCGCSAN